MQKNAKILLIAFAFLVLLSQGFALCSDQGYTFGSRIFIDANSQTLYAGDILKVLEVNTANYTGIASNLSDLAVWDFNGGSFKLARKISQGSSSDVNAYFSLRNPLNDSTAPNSLYYVCAVKVGDTSDTNVSTLLTFDDAANGSTAIGYRGIRKDSAGSANGDYLFDNTQSISASNSIHVQDNSAAGVGMILGNDLTYKNDFNGPVDFNVWVRPTANNKDIVYFRVNGVDAIVFSSSGKILFQAADSGIGYSANTWYLLKAQINPSKTDGNFFVYSATLALVASSLNKSLTPSGPVTTISLNNDGPDGTADRAYWDNLSFFLPRTNVPATTGKILVQIPKDEKTGLPITPYTLLVTGAVAEQQANLTNDFVLDWTVTTGTIYIDVNANGYFTRRYAIDAANFSATLQPYLVSTAFGYQANLWVLDAFSGTGKPNITVKSYKVLTGTTESLIEERITDSIGNARISLVTDETYTLKLYENSVLIHTATINADQTNYYFYFGTTIPQPIDANRGVFDVNFFPSRSFVYQTDLNKMDFNQSIRLQNKQILSIDVNITYNDQNIFSDSNFDLDYNGMLYQDVNALILNGLNATTGTIKIIIKVLATDGNIFYASKSYTFINYTNYYNFQSVLELTIPNLFGGNTNGKQNPALLFLALIITIFSSAGLAAGFQANTIGIGVLSIAMISLFMWIGWITPAIGAIIIIVAFLLVLLGWRRTE